MSAGQYIQLMESNRGTQGMMYARNTARNMKSHIKQWVCFCLHFKRSVIPASIQDLSVFMELMSRSSGYGHLKAVLASISFLHRSLDTMFPTNSFQLDATMMGLKRRLACTPFQVLPISPDILCQMYKHVDLNSKEDLATWCSFLICFFCLFRKASIVPESFHLDSSKILTRGNISRHQQSRTILIYVNHSKVIQYGQRDLVIPLSSNRDPALDPWCHMSLLLSSYPSTLNSPTFTYGPRKCVTYNSFTATLKHWLALSGFDPNLYSSHSFCRGGTTFLYTSGGNILQLQAAGDWSTLCFTKYIFLSMDQRMASQNLMMNKINSTIPRV